MDIELIRDTTHILLKTFPLIKSKMMTGLKSHQDCTHGQMMILFALEEHGALSMSEISAETAISNQQLTRIMDELIAMEYAVRFENKENRRQVIAELTPLGRKFLKKKHKEFFDRCEDYFAEYSEEDIQKIHESLKTIYSILAKN